MKILIIVDGASYFTSDANKLQQQKLGLDSMHPFRARNWVLKSSCLDPQSGFGEQRSLASKGFTFAAIVQTHACVCACVRARQKEKKERMRGREGRETERKE